MQGSELGSTSVDQYDPWKTGQIAEGGVVLRQGGKIPKSAGMLSTTLSHLGPLSEVLTHLTAIHGTDPPDGCPQPRPI